MNDLINGREMLNRYQVDLCYDIACKDCSMSTEEGGCRVEKWIDTFPSADRPQGEWIEVDDVSIRCRCSVCGWEAHLYEDDVYGMPYCPNCGARMRPKLQGTHFDSIIIDECAMKGAADDEI